MKINLRLLHIYLAKIYPRYKLASIIKFLVHRSYSYSTLKCYHAGQMNSRNIYTDYFPTVLVSMPLCHGHCQQSPILSGCIRSE